MRELVRETACGTLRVWIPDNPQISFRRQIEDGALYEPATMDIFATAIPGNGVVYDCGARWGYFSRLAVLCGAGTVLAYEQGERGCLPVLHRNADGNPIEVHETRLTATSADPDAPRPDFVKIDVEGDEHEVVRWLRLRKRLPPTIAIEMHPNDIKEAGSFRHLEPPLSQEDLIEDLREWGYALAYTDSHREQDAEWHPVELSELPTGVTDYLLVGMR